MGIAKVGLGDAVGMRFFIDKEDATNLVGNIAEEMIVAATRAFLTKFTIIVEMTVFFLHGILLLMIAIGEF